MALRAIDLFCGAGGSSQGAADANVEIVGAIDAWDIAVSTYRDNHPGAYVEHRRLGPYSSIGARMPRSNIDILLASPECTNHSVAKGNRPRDEASRATAHYVLEFSARLRPRYVVIENVIQMRDWHGYAPMMRSLTKLGYHLRAQVLDAADFGVAQTRRRLFVVGDLEAPPPEVVPKPGTRPKSAHSVVRLQAEYSSTPLRRKSRAAATLERAERGIRALGTGVPFLIVYYGSDGAGGWQPLDRPLRTITTLDRFGLVTWEDGSPRLRMLQVDELKSAMGLPNNYALNFGTRRDRIKLIGNGVCPPVMSRIVECLTEGRRDVPIGANLRRPTEAERRKCH